VVTGLVPAIRDFAGGPP